MAFYFLDTALHDTALKPLLWRVLLKECKIEHVVPHKSVSWVCMREIETATYKMCSYLHNCLFIECFDKQAAADEIMKKTQGQ